MLMFHTLWTAIAVLAALGLIAAEVLCRATVEQLFQRIADPRTRRTARRNILTGSVALRSVPTTPEGEAFRGRAVEVVHFCRHLQVTCLVVLMVVLVGLPLLA